MDYWQAFISKTSFKGWVMGEADSSVINAQDRRRVCVCVFVCVCV